MKFVGAFLLSAIVTTCCITAIQAQTSVKTAPAVPAAKPASDAIIFTNGDQLSGTLERGVGGSIVFKSDMAGELTIPLDKIKELRSSGTFVVLRKDAPLTHTAAKAGSVMFADGSITVGSSTNSPEVIPAKDAAYIIDNATYQKEIGHSPGFFSGWNGAITAGATFVRSTTNGQTFTAGATLARVVPTVPYLPKRNRTTLNIIEIYGKLTTPNNPLAGLTYSQVETSIFHADAERDEYFTRRFYALANLAFDHNFSQGLALQQLYGGGVGWTAIQDAKQQLDMTAEIHYEMQQFQSSTAGVAPSPNQNLIGATAAETYRRTLPHKIVFTQSANVLPAFNNIDAYSANFAAAIVLPAWKRLGVSFSTTDNYLNDPAAGFNKNSYQFVTGLTYSIH